MHRPLPFAFALVLMLSSNHCENDNIQLFFCTIFYLALLRTSHDVNVKALGLWKRLWGLYLVLHPLNILAILVSNIS